MSNKMVRILVLVIGIGLLVVSLLADVIGIGAGPTFGNLQTTGTVVGVFITAVGLYLTLTAKSD